MDLAEFHSKYGKVLQDYPRSASSARLGSKGKNSGQKDPFDKLPFSMEPTKEGGYILRKK